MYLKPKNNRDILISIGSGQSTIFYPLNARIFLKYTAFKDWLKAGKEGLGLRKISSLNPYKLFNNR